MYTAEAYNPFTRCAQFSAQYYSIIKDELTNQNARHHYQAWGKQAQQRAIADTILTANWVVFGFATLTQLAFESGQEFGKQFWAGWDSIDAIPLYTEPAYTVPVYALPASTTAAIELQAYQAIERQSWKNYVLSCLGYQNGYGVVTAGDRLEKAVRSLGGC